MICYINLKFHIRIIVYFVFTYLNENLVIFVTRLFVLNNFQTFHIFTMKLE